MAAVDEIQKDGFSFTWTIQNISYCIGTSLSSPTFQTGSGVTWSLILYPNGQKGSDTIASNLKLLRSSPLNYKEVASFDISICTSIGMFKREGRQNEEFRRDREFGISSTIRLNDLHKKEPGININNDSLTVRCRIWEINTIPLQFRQFHARTIIVIDRTTYVWNIHNFLDFNNYKKPISQPLIQSEITSFYMELFPTGGAFAKDNIQIQIQPVILVNKFCLFSICKISLLGIDGKVVYSVRDEHRFEKSENVQVWMLSFIPKDKLLSRKDLYLPNGTLSLHCEFAVSSGVKYNEVKINENEIPNLSTLENHKQEKDLEVLVSLNDHLKNFFTDGKFSDLAIRTQNKDYPVHKTILCARSEVFTAMFESDTKEKQTGIIEIEDIDDDIISKMLLFLYTDTIGEDLEFGIASSLYFAADKYRIVALKRKCADFLKGNFTVTNICDVLVLADIHQDQELKSAVQKFIFEHSGEVMDSEEWTALIQNNIQLASETMRLVIRNFAV